MGAGCQQGHLSSAGGWGQSKVKRRHRLQRYPNAWERRGAGTALYKREWGALGELSESHCGEVWGKVLLAVPGCSTVLVSGRGAPSVGAGLGSPRGARPSPPEPGTAARGEAHAAESIPPCSTGTDLRFDAPVWLLIPSLFNDLTFLAGGSSPELTGMQAGSRGGSWSSRSATSVCTVGSASCEFAHSRRTSRKAASRWQGSQIFLASRIRTCVIAVALV